MVLRVPIDGKMTPVLAEGSKGGFFYVMNAKNGGPVAHHKIKETPTYDPSGNGIALNHLAKTQPFPSGASYCAVIVDFTAAALSRCGFPADTLITEYGGTNNVNVVGDKLINAANGWPILGAPESAAHDYGTYLVYGGAGGGGNFGYPPSSYNPVTHTYYACLQNQSGGHSNAGPNTTSLSNVNASSLQGITGFYSAIRLTDNTMLWRYASTADGNGVCYSGSLSTAGNLAFTAFKGRSDVAANLPNMGTTQQGAGSLLTPGANFNAFDATTGKILWTWGIPNDTFISPSITYMYKGKQYIAIYHGVALAGYPGSTPTGQRDQLTVFSL
jgi:hypothetical protein